jgi:hypothetical protein
MLFLVVLACSGDKDALNTNNNALLVHPLPEHEQVFADFVAMAAHPNLSVTEDTSGAGTHVSFELDTQFAAGAYRIDGDDDALTVHGGDLLALQYGLADVLEGKGFRFFHPHRIHTPTDLLASVDDRIGIDHSPDMARRGLHMHTLHPIEGLYDFWEPSKDGLERGKRVIDWVVKNRGNHIQWVAVDNIVRFPNDAEPWVDHTTQLMDYAHARGLTTGLGVQLFGGANLQLAYDLTDATEIDEADMRARLELLMAPGPDLLNLSFGEFSGEEPDVFVAAGNVATRLMHEVDPNIEVTTVIHVGNYDDLRIEYQGEEFLYYFLGTKLDNVTPWIHTTMYYNLFEDAGLAYLHEEFDEHRDYLLNALENDEPVGYFPESAYWVAFDNNIPTYLPLYVRSRWTDMDRIRTAAGDGALKDHVLFSSGWEWGYWQNDMATLRMNYEVPATYEEEVRTWFTPWGTEGDAVAQAVIDTADLEHEALIVNRLAAYLAGREIVIDIGETATGIVSQPDRPSFPEIQAMEPAELAAMATRVDQLEALGADLLAVHSRLATVEDNPFFNEVRDGLLVTSLRATFASQVFGAAVAQANGEDATALRNAAVATLADARAPVDARHADLHWPGGTRIIASEDDNDCLYQWGYLAKAEELCFWDRELVQLDNMLNGTAQSVPPCF